MIFYKASVAGNARARLFRIKSKPALALLGFGVLTAVLGCTSAPPVMEGDSLYQSSLYQSSFTQPPLSAEAGDPARGRSLALRQDKGNCLLCHAFPEPELKFSGDLGPPLHGVGGRYSSAQLRFRLVDASRVNAETVMPAYFRTEGLTRVAPQFQGKTLLSPQEIEDVVAYLSTLK